MAKAGNLSVQYFQEKPQVQAPRSMASQAATPTLDFDRFDSNELVTSIRELREKKKQLIGELNKQMDKEKGDKAGKLQQISVLNDRLQKLEESLRRKISARDGYDKTMQEAEESYKKLLEQFSD
eukprot:TRINITY_DN859_c0_g1_i1.p1 TRINITY_DN859_c0_g1~~TRINITY_DN859_c0_g1_i1.p1  ORF type:complete len:142 (+),score=40.82 TRINITY_DN859_c0_g1_i1:57-428(+)